MCSDDRTACYTTDNFCFRRRGDMDRQRIHFLLSFERRTITDVFSLLRLAGRAHPGSHNRKRAAVEGMGVPRPSGSPGGVVAREGCDARTWMGRWAVGIYREAMAGGGRRRKMKFHKRSIARDEGSVGDGGGHREWTSPWPRGARTKEEREKEKEKVR